MIIQSCDVIKLFAREFERILVSSQVFVHNGLAIRSVAHKLADIAGRICQVAGATEVVGMEEEPVALVGVVALEAVAGFHITHIVALELDWRARHVARRVETHCGRPAAWHVVVAQRYVRQGHTRLVRVGVAAFLRWHTRRYAVLTVVLLHALLHLHQTLLVVFLASGQVEAVHAVHVVEVTTAHLAGYALRTGIVMLGEAVVGDNQVWRNVQSVVVGVVCRWQRQSP